MKKLVLSATEMNKLDVILDCLSADHAEIELACALPTGESSMCKPCKGGCGSIGSLIGVSLEGIPVPAAD